MNSQARRVRGQAIVEFAIVSPILMLVVVGAMWFPLAAIVQSGLVHPAQQGADAGARASGDCGVALEAVAATSTRQRAVAECTFEPGSPDVLRVTLSETLPVPPILDRFTDGVVSGEAASVVP